MSRRILSLALVACLLGGCASLERNRALCALAGGGVGGIGIGGITGEPISTAFGVLVGGALGMLACGEEERAPIVEPAPPPPPAPAPDPDSDGDGIPDSRDACPGTPPGTPVDARGCPQAEELLGVVRDVNFDFDRANLRPNAIPVLEQVAGFMRGNPELRVRLEGHTDSIGTTEYNRHLGAQRAAAVERYLVGQGIEDGRIETLSKGEMEPAADNRTEAGRAENRRVEILRAR